MWKLIFVNDLYSLIELTISLVKGLFWLSIVFCLTVFFITIILVIIVCLMVFIDELKRAEHQLALERLAPELLEAIQEKNDWTWIGFCNWKTGRPTQEVAEALFYLYQEGKLRVREKEGAKEHYCECPSRLSIICFMHNHVEFRSHRPVRIVIDNSKRSL